jgi:transmembrane sensor
MDAQEGEDMPTVSDRTRMVSQEAAYWYFRCIDEPEMSRRDRLLFVRWLKKSPENIREFLRIIDLDGAFAQQRLVDVVKELTDSNVYDICTGEPVVDYDYNPSKSVSDTVPRKIRPTWAVAAVLSAIAIAFLLSFGVFKSSGDAPATTAAVSELHQITLADGSTVYIDARTSLNVEFTAERRLVHLYSGQAVFKVAKDPDRPFTVNTGIVDVTAVGTRFGVAIDPGVTTTVTEGVVKVTPHGKLDDASAVELHAGEQLRIHDSDMHRKLFIFGGASVDLSRLPVLKVDAERKLAWVDGWLKFDGETVDEIVNEFNRRNIQQIKIEDRTIAERRLTGYYRFRADSPESFAKVLDRQEGITVIKDGRNVLRVKSD